MALERIGVEDDESEEEYRHFEDYTRPVWSQDQQSLTGFGTSNMGGFSSSDEASEMQDSQNILRKEGQKRKLNDMPEERVKQRRDHKKIG